MRRLRRRGGGARGRLRELSRAPGRTNERSPRISPRCGRRCASVTAPAELEGALVAAFREVRAGRPRRSPRASGPRPPGGGWRRRGRGARGRQRRCRHGGWRPTGPRRTVSSATNRRRSRTIDADTGVARVAPGVDARAEAPPGWPSNPPGRGRAARRRATRAHRPAGGRRRRRASTYTSLPAALPRWSDAPLVPVRLQVPYAALPALGVQITRGQWGETVPVEVLVGEDGIARGIRLVNNEVMNR